MRRIRIKRLVCVLLSGAFFLAAAVPARAAEVTPELVYYSAAENPELWEDSAFSVIDSAELTKAVNGWMTEYGANDTQFALSYCFTGTGETWSYNGDAFFQGRSLYKLPLIMGIARDVADGILSQDGTVLGMKVNYVEERALIRSNNPVSEAAMNYYEDRGGFYAFAAELSGLAEPENLTELVASNRFSSNMMLRYLTELFTNEEKYPNVIDCMLQANPGQYFAGVDYRWRVAHKYGGGEGTTNDAGIIYTDTPFLLVVMTEHYVPNADILLAQIAEYFTGYTQTVADRLEYVKQQALKEEEARLAAEEQAEQERLLAEEAERQRALETQRQAEAEAQAEQERLLAAQQQAQQEKMQRTVVFSGSAVLGALVLFVLVAILARSKKKKKQDDIY